MGKFHVMALSNYKEKQNAKKENPNRRSDGFSFSSLYGCHLATILYQLGERQEMTHEGNPESTFYGSILHRATQEKHILGGLIKDIPAFDIGIESKALLEAMRQGGETQKAIEVPFATLNSKGEILVWNVPPEGKEIIERYQLSRNGRIDEMYNPSCITEFEVSEDDTLLGEIKSTGDDYFKQIEEYLEFIEFNGTPPTKQDMHHAEWTANRLEGYNYQAQGYCWIWQAKAYKLIIVNRNAPIDQEPIEIWFQRDEVVISELKTELELLIKEKYEAQKIGKFPKANAKAGNCARFGCGFMYKCEAGKKAKLAYENFKAYKANKDSGVEMT